MSKHSAPIQEHRSSVQLPEFSFQVGMKERGLYSRTFVHTSYLNQEVGHEIVYRDLMASQSHGFSAENSGCNKTQTRLQATNSWLLRHDASSSAAPARYACLCNPADFVFSWMNIKTTVAWKLVSTPMRDRRVFPVQ